MLQQSNRERRDGHFFTFPLLFTEAITEIYGDAVRYGTMFKICFHEPGAAPPRPLKTSTIPLLCHM